MKAEILGILGFARLRTPPPKPSSSWEGAWLSLTGSQKQPIVRRKGGKLPRECYLAKGKLQSVGINTPERDTHVRESLPVSMWLIIAGFALFLTSALLLAEPFRLALDPMCYSASVPQLAKAASDEKGVKPLIAWHS